MGIWRSWRSAGSGDATSIGWEVEVSAVTPAAADHRSRQTLQTVDGEVPLAEYRLGLAGREWSVLHTGALLTAEEEQAFLGESRERLPYGVALWPAAIALAHDVAARPDAFDGRRVLELGAGTGLPGIVAASLGAHVVQSDRKALALEVCRRNGVRNGVSTITYRLADWTAWDDSARYDWILGSDILYGAAMHEPLARIFRENLAPGGRVLLADPFRPASLPLLETLEASGWEVVLSKWRVGETTAPRVVGIFELTPPPAARDGA
ncbi:MAG: methyltransferase domain-containing protein [Gemmatirosa sp.]|nr:methyltransferase domain-containing protein [Gemmatirosa sp.]